MEKHNFLVCTNVLNVVSFFPNVVPFVMANKYDYANVFELIPLYNLAPNSIRVRLEPTEIEGSMAGMC